MKKQGRFAKVCAKRIGCEGGFHRNCIVAYGAIPYNNSGDACRRLSGTAHAKLFFRAFNFRNNEKGAIFIPTHGFAKIAAVSPPVRLGDPVANAQAVADAWREADGKGALLAVFPELCLTGATLGDLFFRSDLLSAARLSLETLLETGAALDCAALIGLPLAIEGRTYNASLLMAQGEILSIVPLRPTPEQARWFSRYDAPARDVECAGHMARLGEDVFSLGGVALGVARNEEEIPTLSRRGAHIVLLPVARRARAGFDALRARDIAALARVSCCAVAAAFAGPGESVSGGVYAGDCVLIEAGEHLAGGRRFDEGGQIAIADIDVQGLAFMRRTRAEAEYAQEPLPCAQGLRGPRYDAQTHFARAMCAHPLFVEGDDAYADAFAIQVAALKRRMRHVRTDKVVLAWSGGLDSTCALLVARRAVSELGGPPTNVIAVSMPGLATSDTTKGNARSLAQAIGCDFREIDIRKMCLDELLAIGHDGVTPDVTYENVQARLRTAIALNIANLTGALQLSTGDMSELALGWCTYGGDQTGMYGVNAGIPKTMLQRMVRWHAYLSGNEALRETLMNVLATPISPELTPGSEMQSTEGILGPYELHDFFLYHYLVRGAGREKLRFLAEKTEFDRVMTEKTIEHALDVFMKRMNASQFKRVTAPEGPAVLEASLSPVSGLVLPSDLA